MFTYNFSGEIITNATRGFWLLAVVLVISVVYYFMHINAITLLSQSGKAERIARFESKKKKDRKAKERKAISFQQKLNYIAECKKHSVKNNNTKKQVSNRKCLDSQSGEEEQPKRNYLNEFIIFYLQLFKCLFIFLFWYALSFLFSIIVRICIEAVKSPKMKKLMEDLGIPDLANPNTTYGYVYSPWKEAKDFLFGSMSSQSGDDLDEEDTEYFKEVFGKGKKWLGELFEFIISKIDIDVDKHYTTLGYLRACKLIKQLNLIFDILVSLEILENFSIEIKGYKIFTPSKLGKKTKPFDLLDACYEFCSLFVKTCWAFPEKGFKAFYEDAINGVFEEDYAYVLSSYILFETGKNCDVDDVKEYDLRLQRAIDAATTSIKANSEKAYYTPKLKELKVLQAKRIASQKDFIRMKPYGILLFGGSSVGKSSIANAVTRYILKVNGFRASSDSVVVLNEADKFQSEFRTHHTGVILDDLCNSTVETTEGNPLLKVIQFINNSPQAALNPNADLKGNIMIEPRVVLATTNVKDLNASHYSNEPLSVARRFDITVTQTVREKYQLSDSAMLDSAKVERDFAGIAYPDFALFTLERPILHSGNIRQGNNKTQRVTYVPIVFKGKEMREVSLCEFLEFLKENTAKHFKEQRSFVKTQRDNVDIQLDDEGFPLDINRTNEVLDSEFGILDNVFQKYYDLEALVFRKISELVFIILSTKICRNWIISKYCIDICVKVIFVYTICLMCITHHPRIYVVLILTIQIQQWLLYKALCYVIKYKIQHMKKPSDYLREMTMLDRARFISMLGGITAMSMIGSVIKLIYDMLTSEAAEYMRPSVDITEKKKEHSATEFWDEHSRYKRFTFNPRISGSARCTTPDQLTGMVSRRIMMIHIKLKNGKTRFCNCLPIRGNMALIPSHVVPDYDAEALITKPGANPKNVSISMQSCYRIPKTDICVWYVPELGDQRDLTAYFPGDIAHGKQIVGDMVYNDQGEIKTYRKLLGTRTTNRTTLGGSFESLSYYFPEQTFQGLCMATFVGRDNKDMPFIGGFHLGGKNHTAAAGFITRDQVLEAIDNIAKKPSILPSHAGQSFETIIGDIDVGPLQEPHELCVTRNLDSDARCVVYGAHNRPGATPKSEVVISSISQKVQEHLGLERMHDKPHMMRDIMHKEVDIENKTHTAYRFDAALVDKAVVDFNATLTSKLKKKLHNLGKLDDDVVLAGLDGVVGINAMNFATACGFPLSGPKTTLVSKSERIVEGISCPRDIDPKVLDEIKKLEETLLDGNRINTVFKASLKDEPTKIGKKKVRVFAGCNIYFIMLVRKYFLSISALMQQNKEVFECAVGLNVESPEWTKMMKHVYKHGVARVVAGDYKSFDGRMSPRFMLASFKILINLAELSGNYDADDLTIMRGIATEICSPTYDYFGTLVQFYGSNPSGHPLTVVTNSLVNSLYMRYVYYKIAQEERWWKTPLFSDVVALLTYGDDNIMSVRKGYDAYNHTNIARVLADSDITYTMADKEAGSVPFIHGFEAGFLKHNAVWDDELQLYRAVIEESSIAKMLHAHGKSQISEELHAACTIKDALDKYAHFGREKYTERCAQLKQVADECNLTGLVGSFPTYQEQILKYCEKYEWDENPYPPSKEE
jgi:hypothetical protein